MQFTTDKFDTRQNRNSRRSTANHGDELFMREDGQWITLDAGWLSDNKENNNNQSVRWGSSVSEGVR